MSLTFAPTEVDSVVAVGICGVGSLNYQISSGSELSVKGEKDVSGSAVIDFLLTQVSYLQGTTDEEKKELSAWNEKQTSIEELNTHLKTRVYVLDGLKPSIVDLRLFASLRDQIKKQKTPERNEFCNVTRWFNHLQAFFAPSLSPLPIKLAYTAPKKVEKPKNEGKENAKASGQRRAPQEKAVGFARLSLRVGKIIDIKVHSKVESLYVESVDLGEEAPRTIVSKLAEKIPIKEMEGRLVVVASNLATCDLQGVVSQGLVFCASIGDKTEVLSPPEGSKIGEQITVEGTKIVPDQGQSITKKIFSRAIKGLKTNSHAVACFKDIPLMTSAGPVTVLSLKAADIK